MVDSVRGGLRLLNSRLRKRAIPPKVGGVRSNRGSTFKVTLTSNPRTSSEPTAVKREGNG